MTATQPALPETVVLPLDEIKPYWRNPRRIPEEAIAAVAQSITDYGYQQPIVVDAEHVIVVGHTRHAALARLGYDEVPVYVIDLPEEKAKEYRLIDNRTSEMTSWDHSALVMELREWESGLLAQYFPDVDLEVGQVNDALVTAQDVEKGVEDAMSLPAPRTLLTTKVTCPACFHSFEVSTDSLPGLSHADLAELRDGQASV